MKSTIFVLLAVAILLPRSASAASIRSVDNSDYGKQGGIACTDFSNTSAYSPACSFGSFLAQGGDYLWGYMVTFTAPVQDVEVTFSNVTILNVNQNAALEICDDSGNSCFATGGTPSLNLTTHPGALSLFSMPAVPTFGVPGSSVTFDLNGAIAAGTGQGNQVSFLLLCSADDGSSPFGGAGAPADAGCSGAKISVSSLASQPPPNPVPEPASLLLCGIGTGTAMLGRRVKNRRR